MAEIHAVRRRLGRLTHERLAEDLDPASARSYEELCALERSLIDAEGPIR